MLSRIPFPVIVSAPSGTGKTTLCRAVAKREEGVKFLVSCTTRPKRKGEVDGEDYRFLEASTFEKWIEEGKFLEWAIYGGSYYGTLRKGFDSSLKKGFDVIADLDVQGATKLMEIYPDAVFIYILPPSKEELRRRLKKRDSDPKEEMAKRLFIAEEELRSAKTYQYIVVNREFDKTVEAIVSIIRAERLRSRRLREPLEIVKWDTQTTKECDHGSHTIR